MIPNALCNAVISLLNGRKRYHLCNSPNPGQSTAPCPPYLVSKMVYNKVEYLCPGSKRGGSSTKYMQFSFPHFMAPAPRIPIGILLSVLLTVIPPHDEPQDFVLRVLLCTSSIETCSCCCWALLWMALFALFSSIILSGFCQTMAT